MTHENTRKNTRRALGLAILLTTPLAWSAPPEDGCPEGCVDDENHYGEAGSFELGGSLGFMWLEDSWSVSGSPTFGYFVVDRWELSLITTGQYTRSEDEDGSRSSAGTFLIEVEPSYHHPLGERLLAFVGVGVGTEYDEGWLFDLIPRVGVNIKVGKSAVITPAFKVPIGFGAEEGVSPGVTFDLGVGTTW